MKRAYFQTAASALLFFNAIPRRVKEASKNPGGGYMVRWR